MDSAAAAPWEAWAASSPASLARLLPSRRLHLPARPSPLRTPRPPREQPPVQLSQPTERRRPWPRSTSCTSGPSRSGTGRFFRSSCRVPFPRAKVFAVARSATFRSDKDAVVALARRTPRPRLSTSVTGACTHHQARTGSGSSLGSPPRSTRHGTGGRTSRSNGTFWQREASRSDAPARRAVDQMGLGPPTGTSTPTPDWCGPSSWWCCRESVRESVSDRRRPSRASRCSRVAARRGSPSPARQRSCGW